MKYHSDDNSYFRVEIVDKMANKIFQENIFKYLLEACLVQ